MSETTRPDLTREALLASTSCSWDIGINYPAPMGEPEARDLDRRTCREWRPQNLSELVDIVTARIQDRGYSASTLSDLTGVHIEDVAAFIAGSDLGDRETEWAYSDLMAIAQVIGLDITVKERR